MAYNMNEDDDDDWDSDDLEDDEDEDDDEYDEDPDLDDDEDDRPRPNKYLHPEERAAKEDAARSRRMLLSGLKILLSAALLGGVAAYLFVPTAKEDFRRSLNKLSPYVQKAKTAVENVADRFSGKKERNAAAPERPPVLRPAGTEKRPALPPAQKPAPVLSPERPAPSAAPERTGPAEEKKPAVETARVRPLGRRFNLSGSGDLPDLETAMKTNPALKETLLKDKSVYTLERLWQIRPFVRGFIFQWAGVDSEKAVEAKVRMPYEMFERRVLSELLPFTTFRAVGLTPSYDTNYIKEPPVEAVGKFYRALSPVLADQTTEQGLETLRPVVRFMQYRCGRDKECAESLERMIQMLGYDDKTDELMK